MTVQVGDKSTKAVGPDAVASSGTDILPIVESDPSTSSNSCPAPADGVPRPTVVAPAVDTSDSNSAIAYHDMVPSLADSMDTIPYDDMAHSPDVAGLLQLAPLARINCSMP